MFGSQTLDTAIGLTLMFFIIATAASMIVEIIARIMQKRAKDLEGAIGAMLTGKTDPKDVETKRDLKDVLDIFKGTSLYNAAENAAGRSVFRHEKLPSYLSAKAFADASLEMLQDKTADGKSTVLKPWDDVPENLRKRLAPLVREARDDLVKVKSGLETWFDETMDRAQGAYKRWTTLWLFVAGLVIAVVGNASTIDVARDLYSDTATREAVVEAAQNAVADGDAGSGESTDCANTSDSDSASDSSDSESETADPTGLGAVACATSKLEAAQLPVGWEDTTSEDWDGFIEISGHVLGWLLTALLVMLGAPFWFDLLTRLVSLRNAGSKPPPAAVDPASYTNQQVAEATATPRDEIQRQVEAANNVPLVSEADLHAALAAMLRVGTPANTSEEPGG